MRIGHKSMQRRIDGGGHPVLAECRERIVSYHLVVVLFAAIDALELFEAVEIQQCKSRFFNGPEIATAAFHREDARGLPGKWIRQLHFGAGVSSDEICDPEVGSEQIGAIA